MRAFLYLMRVGIQKVIGFLLYAVGTGFTMTYAGTLYFAYLFVTTLIINCIGVSMIFPYISVWICMAVAIMIIIVRTALEDKMLQEGLMGYLEYTHKTKYRLVPFIW